MAGAEGARGERVCCCCGGGGGRGALLSVLTFLVPGPPAIRDTPVREEERPGCPPRVSCWGDIASMKKPFEQIPALEAMRSCPQDRGRRGKDARGKGCRRGQAGSGARGAGSAPPVGAMYRRLRSVPWAGSNCSGDRGSAPRLAPPQARPLSAGLPVRGPAPGRPPPAAALPVAALACGGRARRLSIYMLGHRRPTDLLNPTLRVGSAQRSSRVCVMNQGL